MSAQGRGGDLFIVDNSVSGWTSARYLREWTEIAKSFDIATGFFEIGGLLELDGDWQKLDKVRVLMGAEVTHRTRSSFLRAIRERAEAILDASLDDEKRSQPFLRGVEAIVDALKDGRIECRVYTEDKFHAKAYITHAKLDVVGAQALVGSSNFTRPGLTQNIELNIQVQSGREVAQLQDWFEQHWKVSEDITPELLAVVERHTRDYQPFEIYAKALREYFRGRELSAGEWDQSASQMFGRLDRYQQEAYWSLMKIAGQHGGPSCVTESDSARRSSASCSSNDSWCTSGRMSFSLLPRPRRKQSGSRTCASTSPAWAAALTSRTSRCSVTLI